MGTQKWVRFLSVAVISLLCIELCYGQEWKDDLCADIQLLLEWTLNNQRTSSRSQDYKIKTLAAHLTMILWMYKEDRKMNPKMNRICDTAEDGVMRWFNAGCTERAFEEFIGKKIRSDCPNIRYP